MVQLHLLCCLACGYCGYNQKDTEIYYDDDEDATMKTAQYFEEQRNINGSNYSNEGKKEFNDFGAVRAEEVEIEISK